MGSPTRYWWSGLSVALVGIGLLSGAGAGCSDESRLQSADLIGLDTGGVAAGTAGPCPSGLRRECTITLARQGDVLSCLKGSQLCAAGKWGACDGDEKFDMPASSTTAAAPLKTLSIDLTPQACPTNPCDPACRFFDEQPVPPYEPLRNPALQWQTGSALDYPSTTTGLVQPCTAASDCQLGTQCQASIQSCVRHVSGQSDLSCATFDLIVAPTCRDGVTDVIPVCNRGSTAAPAGIKVAHLAPGQIRTPNPNLTGATSCTTTAPVPPGKCVNVQGCGALTNGREIVVNPQDGTHVATECSFTNNWSVFQNGACNKSLCQAGKATKALTPACSIPLRGSQNVGTTLLGRWPFDTNSGASAGSTTPDVSPSANNGTIAVGAPPWVPGRIGSAFFATPLGNFVQMGTRDLGNTTNVSVALWMQNAGANNYAGGLITHLNTATNQGWQIQRTAAGRIQVELGAVGSTLLYNATLAPADNNWHHVAFTWNGADGALRIYLDGRLTESATHSVVTTLGVGGRDLTIGRTPANNTFQGALDDVSIYSGVLTAAQIYQMSLSGEATAGLPPYARMKFTPFVPPPSPDPSCPPQPSNTDALWRTPGWVQWGNKCYIAGSQHAPIYPDLENICIGKGGHLMSLNRPEEQTFMVTRWGAAAHYVFGMRDAVEGDWQWNDGSCRAWFGAQSVIPWAPDQPEGNIYDDEDCSWITPEFDPGWRDISCDQANDDYPFFCERPLLNPQGKCAPGEVARPGGGCYLYVATPATHAQAATQCAARGAGWALAAISSVAENNFAAGLLNCEQAWIGSATGAEFLPGEPNGTAGVDNCLRIDALGDWLDDVCSATRPYLCEGPVVPPPAPEEFTRVASAAACTANNQYYLDDPFHPTLATLCPATCTRFAAASANSVTYEAACLAPIDVRVITQTYESDCGAGTEVQWSFLVHHTVTPENASVKFDVRTAASVGELSGVTFQAIQTAQRTPTDTQNCWYADNCKVNLFTTLGTPANRTKVLELRATVTPSTSGVPAELQDWEVTYSCQAAQ